MSLKTIFPLKQGQWTELSRKRVYENPWIDLDHSEVINPNGGKGIYGKVHFKNYAIGILAIDRDDMVYLVGQERFPFGGEYTWEIIEGGGPLSDEPLLSAQRELKEETGLEAECWDFLLRMQLSNSVSDEVALVYLARDLKEGLAEPDATEKLSVKKLSFDKALAWVLEGRIQDSISVAAILRYALMRNSVL